MIKFKSDNYVFTVRGVGIVLHNGKVLVQKRKGDSFWALPGGRVELGEKSEITPIRELEEEIGVAGFTKQRLLYVCESFYDFNEINHHQIAFYYTLNTPKNFKYANIDEFEGIEQGKNIIYSWIDLNDIESAEIKPEFLKTELKDISPRVKHIIEEE